MSSSALEYNKFENKAIIQPPFSHEVHIFGVVTSDQISTPNVCVCGGGPVARAGP